MSCNCHGGPDCCKLRAPDGRAYTFDEMFKTPSYLTFDSIRHLLKIEGKNLMNFEEPVKICQPDNITLGELAQKITDMVYKKLNIAGYYDLGSYKGVVNELKRFNDSVSLSTRQKAIISDLKSEGRNLAEIILKFVPAGADRSAAIRSLRLAIMQANAAICFDWPENNDANDK